MTTNGGPVSTQSLDQLEGNRWPDPGPEATRLMRDVHTARTMPLVELRPSQLRVLVRQEVGLPHVVPVALHALAGDPLLEADYYPGDLLAALLELAPGYWSDHPAEADIVSGLLDAVDPADERLLDAEDLMESAAAFRQLPR